jgi:uncharacterized membrane protein affecting hemolysin expression
MKHIILILILMLVTNQQASLVSNGSKFLRVEQVNEIKHSEQSNYNINMSINPMYGLPQVWFW